MTSYPYCPACRHQTRRHDPFGCRTRPCKLPDGTGTAVGGCRCTAPPQPERPTTTPLTVQRLACIKLAARGKSNAEIALDLHIGVDTVKAHLRHAYRTLKARDRAHAVAICYDRGLLKPGASRRGTR